MLQVFSRLVDGSYLEEGKAVREEEMGVREGMAEKEGEVRAA
jgi:hypothetical protein